MNNSNINYSQKVVEMKKITKKFGNFVANDNIDLTVHKGEVHALLGENGAGKSTLMNILYGLYQQTSGDIYINEKLVNMDNPNVAIANGIGMVHQHFMLVQPFTVAQNIILGVEPTKGLGAIDLNKTPEENIIAVSKALGKKTTQMTIAVQDRERHNYIIEAARKLGTRIQMFGDGDVATAIATCFEDTGIDMMMGIGGGPEGVITAAAIKCMGGDMKAQIYPLSEQELNRCYELGFTDEELEKVLDIEDLAKGDNLFFAATGITEGDLLSGVKHIGDNKAKTQSVVMRAKTGTIRFVDAIHSLDKNDILVELMKKYNIE